MSGCLTASFFCSVLCGVNVPFLDSRTLRLLSIFIKQARCLCDIFEFISPSGISRNEITGSKCVYIFVWTVTDSVQEHCFLILWLVLDVINLFSFSSSGALMTTAHTLHFLLAPKSIPFSKCNCNLNLTPDLTILGSLRQLSALLSLTCAAASLTLLPAVLQTSHVCLDFSAIMLRVPSEIGSTQNAPTPLVSDFYRALVVITNCFYVLLLCHDFLCGREITWE